VILALVHRVCPSSVGPLGAKICQSKNSTLRISFERNSSQCRSVRALSFGGNNARCRWIRRQRCSRKGCPRWMYQCESAYRSDPCRQERQDWFQGIRCFHSQRSIADDSGPESNPESRRSAALRFISKMLHRYAMAFRHRPYRSSDGSARYY